MIDAKCRSTHREDLADGRSLMPGEVAADVDEAHPHNAAMFADGRLLAIPNEPSFDVTKATIEQVIGHVGEDLARATAALTAEQDRGTAARSTLIERLTAIVNDHKEDPSS